MTYIADLDALMQEDKLKQEQLRKSLIERKITSDIFMLLHESWSRRFREKLWELFHKDLDSKR